MLWPFFTKQNPCPACGHHDWSCRAGDRKFICMRVASDHPSNTSDGGWFHAYKGSKHTDRPLRVNSSQLRYVLKEPETKLKQLTGKYSEKSVEVLAKNISVSFDSLIELGCVALDTWNEKNNINFGFPMRNGAGKVTGIRTRDWSGNKKAVYGSLSGCFYSDSPEALELLDAHNIAFICEGPTDAAALLTLGFFPIGKPSCNACNEIVIEVLRRLKIPRAVIVTDNDSIKPKTGTRPGIESAKKLKSELHVPSIIWMPPSPIKDVRQFVREGGTREMILDDLKTKIFSR